MTASNLSVYFVLLFLFTQVYSTWWYVSQLPTSAVRAGYLCDNIPGLVRRQRKICRKFPDAMISISSGAKLGVAECKAQFKASRWNCSTSARDPTVFGKVVLQGTREAAFVHAIMSAAVVHKITKACSRGDLVNCNCDPRLRGYGRDKRGEFAWGGCSDNVRYGCSFSRMFIDAREKKIRDARALMNLHNNRAGRRAVRRFMKLECKCHGVSGSCAIRTCWRAMVDFSKVGGYLRTKFNGATQVMMNQDGTGLIVANKNHKRQTHSDLLYLESSPDHCDHDSRSGSHGTSGRQCNKTSLGTDGCDIMCCGRGYDTTTAKVIEKCDCKFQWCCVVKCRDCERIVDVHTCKPIPESPNFLQNNEISPSSKLSQNKNFTLRHNSVAPPYDNTVGKRRTNNYSRRG